MGETKYTVDYFIDKFEAIPENRWCAGSLVKIDVKDGHNRHCALGHCGAITTWESSLEADSLIAICCHHHYLITEINDGEDGSYLQATPKQRVLAALYDIKNGKND